MYNSNTEWFSNIKREKKLHDTFIKSFDYSNTVLSKVLLLKQFSIK